MFALNHDPKIEKIMERCRSVLSFTTAAGTYLGSSTVVIIQTIVHSKSRSRQHTARAFSRGGYFPGQAVQWYDCVLNWLTSQFT